MINNDNFENNYSDIYFDEQESKSLRENEDPCKYLLFEPSNRSPF